VYPRAGLDEVEKRKFLTLPGLELQPSVAQPVASRIPAELSRLLTSIGYSSYTHISLRHFITDNKNTWLRIYLLMIHITALSARTQYGAKW
jgi:hypothetical protein